MTCKVRRCLETPKPDSAFCERHDVMWNFVTKTKAAKPTFRRVILKALRKPKKVREIKPVKPVFFTKEQLAAENTRRMLAVCRVPVCNDAPNEHGWYCQMHHDRFSSFSNRPLPDHANTNSYVPQ